jgi:hypothetical protein
VKSALHPNVVLPISLLVAAVSTLFFIRARRIYAKGIKEETSWPRHPPKIHPIPDCSSLPGPGGLLVIP